VEDGVGIEKKNGGIKCPCENPLMRSGEDSHHPKGKGKEKNP
jgi:hypothetical protein